MRVAAMNQGLPTAKAPPCKALAESRRCGKLWVQQCGGQAPASGSLQPTVYRTAPALAADRWQELGSSETKRTWNKRDYKGNSPKTSVSGQKKMETEGK